MKTTHASLVCALVSLLVANTSVSAATIPSVHDEGGFMFCEGAQPRLGYQDRVGKFVVRPGRTDTVSVGVLRTYCRTESEDTRSFNDGLGAVQSDGKWGFISKT